MTNFTNRQTGLGGRAGCRELDSSVLRMTAAMTDNPPATVAGLGVSAYAIQTQIGANGTSSPPISATRDTDRRLVPAVSSSSPSPSWVIPNSASSASCTRWGRAACARGAATMLEASEEIAAIGSDDALWDRRVAMIVRAISTVMPSASRSPSIACETVEPPNISATPMSATALHQNVTDVVRSPSTISATAAVTNGAVP